MINFLEYLIPGILVGGLYSLIAVGIVLIYKASGVFNFAQGELMMFGAFVVWFFADQIGLPIWISFLVAMGIAVLMGTVIERLTIRPLVGQPVLAIIMMTIGLSVFIKGFGLVALGTTWKGFPEVFPAAPLMLGDIVTSQQHVWSFAIAMLTLIAFYVFFQHTNTGLAMKALAEDHQLAQSTGINVNRSMRLIWILACLLATMGGFLLATLVGVSYTLGGMGMKAFPAVLFGGLESIPGAVIGGLVIGAVENVASGYLDVLVGGGLKEVAPYILLLLVLIFRPYGLFGLKRIERI